MDGSEPLNTGPQNTEPVNTEPVNTEPVNTEPVNTESGNAAVKDAGEEAAALEAVATHHGSMLKRLDALVSTLTQAVKTGEAVTEHDAHGVLLEWCETELLPHALAEEGPVYGGAGRAPEGRLLVAALLAEHQALVGLIEELRGASGVDAAVAAGAIRNVFAVHLDKENRLLLPLIVASPGPSLARAVEGLSELVGEAHVHRARPGLGGSV
ncbi:hypothetical protein QFZ79_003443 [Arthrobacter sp. V4I6]|uniref:hemerythrin domain-containing protein n=1 Tax=unclassified Arthrobacter TaxID=235627 RepID=UPI002789D90E|nr:MULTISPECIES: hemerythrin domain-containing protein [unclassified Arthrobacter]MDQ0821070.1 hypothetical protein [Arthrobacter sp. V1I7]MDQ0855332.1 hypothetical protein [Arthrobacter sp. V4I6]